MIRRLWSALRSKNLSIRRRLDIASGLMIVVTIITTIACCIGCVTVTVAWARRTRTLSVMHNDDVLLTCRAITEQIVEAISDKESGDTTGLAQIEQELDDDSAYVLIYRGGREYYSFGYYAAVDKNLLNAADEIGSSGYISSGNRQLYMRDVAVEGEEYTVYIFISKVHNPYNNVAAAILVVGVAMVAVFLLAFLLARYFLRRYIFAKIEQPLETLETGVRQLHGGNLGYRIDYSAEDEFRPICDSFNDMAAQLQASRDSLRHQEQNRKELLASISHDLRSPLTTIGGYADGLIDGIAPDEPTRQRYLHQIKAKVGEMIRMVNRLFMFSKMDMDEYPDYPQSLELSREVSAFVEAVRQEYEDRGLLIALTRAEEFPVRADPKQLYTIFANLMENSLRYKSAAVGHLEISLEAEGDHCRLVFRDDGPGVAEAELEKIFEVFYRSDPARKNAGAGSGLGLAIVANAVKRAGGRVRAANAQPHGLEIIITLPRNG